MEKSICKYCNIEERLSTRIVLLWCLVRVDNPTEADVFVVMARLGDDERRGS